jgi:DNA gyrase/topoisomerase IV subunit A
LSKGDGEVFLVSAQGQSIRFKEEEVRAMGAAAAGVQGIKITGADDRIVAMDIVQPKGEALVISDIGLGKRVPMKDFPTQGRYGQGTVAMPVKGKSAIVGLLIADPDTKFVLVTSKGGGRVAKLDEAPKRSRTARAGTVVTPKPNELVERVVAMTPRFEVQLPEPPKPAKPVGAKVKLKVLPATKLSKTKSKAKKSKTPVAIKGKKVKQRVR